MSGVDGLKELLQKAKTLASLYKKCTICMTFEPDACDKCELNQGNWLLEKDVIEFFKDFISRQRLSKQVQARMVELQGSKFKVYGDSIRQLDWVLSLLNQKGSVEAQK